MLSNQLDDVDIRRQILSIWFYRKNCIVREYFHSPHLYFDKGLPAFSFRGVDNHMKTISTLEKIVEAYGFEWDAFRDSLDEMDKEAFISLLHHAKVHAEAGSKIQNPDLFESVVMSILVEHQKELQQLQGRLLQPQTKTCPRCGKTSALEEFFKGESSKDGVTILCQDCREALFYVPSTTVEKI
jgi:hypothetical protein